MNNFVELTKGSGLADLRDDLRALVLAPNPSDQIFRDMVQSSDLDDAHITLASADGCVRVSTGANRTSDEPLWLDIGCVSKLVTSTVIQIVLKSQRGSLTHRLSDILDVGNVDYLSDVTLEHLLNHTHGINEPQGIAVQYARDGTIDVQAVLSHMGSDPLCSPGRLYSYACIGPWLIAAVLERLCGERFIDIVRQVLPTIIRAPIGNDALCPALGGTARVNAEYLLSEFVKATAFATPLAVRQVKLGPALSVPYPGWHPQERAICAGWKAYSHGWFGHQAIITNTPMMLRIAPSEGFGFVVSSRSVHPWRILNALFAEELVGRPTPMKMTPHQAHNGDRIGTYRRVDSTILVSGSTALRLDAQVHPTTHQNLTATSWSSELRPIGHEVFKMSSNATTEMNQGFVQFVRGERGDVTHLWNGGMLWRKVA